MRTLQCGPGYTGCLARFQIASGVSPERIGPVARARARYRKHRGDPKAGVKASDLLEDMA